VADQSGWIASEATAEEVLSTVWRGSRARYFPGEVLRDAWVRLAAAGGLPDATNELVRLGHQRLRQHELATEDREQGELLWPTRVERKHFVPAFVGSSGTLYEIVSQNPSGAELDRHSGVSLVAARRGEALWVQPETPWYRANLPAWLQGDIVIPVEDPDSMQTSVAWTKELIPAEYTTAICTALMGTLRAAGRHP
jgi:hypothetical protein